MLPSFWTLLKAWCWLHIGELLEGHGHGQSLVSEASALEIPGESWRRTEGTLGSRALQVPQALLEQGKVPPRAQPRLSLPLQAEVACPGRSSLKCISAGAQGQSNDSLVRAERKRTEGVS